MNNESYKRKNTSVKGKHLGCFLKKSEMREKQRQNKFLTK